jgi:UDP-N-acetylglucosamine 2-epimerase (non-hydrolysing)
MEKGCFVLAGISKESLLQAVDLAVNMTNNDDIGLPVMDYVDECVSNKIVKIIQSYTGVVDKYVWHK